MNRITVYGEAALHVVSSVVPRPDVRLGAVELTVGGPAAVVATQLARLGHRPRFVGTVGDDAPGRYLRQELLAAGVDCTDLAGSGRTARIIAAVPDQRVRLAADIAGQAALPADVPPPDPGPSYITGFPALSGAVRSLGERGHRLVVDVGFVPLLAEPERLLAHVRALAAAVDVAVVSGADLDPRYRAGISEVCLAAGARAVLTTLGADGVVVHTEHGEKHLPAYRVTAVDPLCAGDCFVAGFLAAQAEGHDVPTSAAFGQAVAAVKVTRFGALPDRADVENFRASRGGDRA